MRTSEGAGALGSRGHAWVAIVDKKGNVTCVGFFPDTETTITNKNPTADGTFGEESKNRFDVARAYELSEEEYGKLQKYLAKSKKSKDWKTYHVSTNNCTDYALKVMKKVNLDVEIEKEVIRFGVDADKPFGTNTPKKLGELLERKQQGFRKSRIITEDE